MILFCNGTSDICNKSDINNSWLNSGICQWLNNNNKCVPTECIAQFLCQNLYFLIFSIRGVIDNQAIMINDFRYIDALEYLIYHLVTKLMQIIVSKLLINGWCNDFETISSQYNYEIRSRFVSYDLYLIFGIIMLS